MKETETYLHAGAAGRLLRRAFVLLGAMSASLPAQQGIVSGVVYDSLSMRPLASASVQVVARDAPEGVMHTALTDANGRYELALQPGSYLAVFEAAELDTLGIKVKPVPFEVRADERTTADMSVPPPARIVTALCGEADEAIGAVIGFLRDARSGNPVDGGRVEGSWHELTIRKGGMRYEEVGGVARVRGDGWFVLCGVVPEGDVFLAASRESENTSAVLVRIPEHGLLRRDFHVGGTATLRGTVVTEKGPARGAEIRVSGRERAAITDSAGRFVFPSAPAGTQSVEARMLGHFPDRQLVNIPADSGMAFSFRLTTFKKVMDTVRVVAERVYASRMTGFHERKARGGAGTFYDAERIAGTREKDLYGVLQRVPGIRVSDWRGGKRIAMRDGQTECVPTLYVDRARVDSGVLAELGLLLPLVEIGGVEVYRGANVPAEFPVFSGCGVIVIWTQPVTRR